MVDTEKLACVTNGWAYLSFLGISYSGPGTTPSAGARKMLTMPTPAPSAPHRNFMCGVLV